MSPRCRLRHKLIRQCKGRTIMFNIIGIEYKKCKRMSSERQRLARSTDNLISYWLMKTWTGIILQQQLRYGVVVLTFSFLQRCSLKLKITQAELIVLHATVSYGIFKIFLISSAIRPLNTVKPA